ncbi:cytochrome c oxidase subunit II [Fulvitalea axinellae]|uniref:Cytochrome c oxidase subunit 2 n=1 Tax=Fulvitalea axinellae TaxID=1182444 RepID=A0AAU9CQU0_9BACT|nr:cytochrome c oxidase subunit II [Fulvitalea axinellae]
MVKLVIATGVLLILVAVFLIFRISTLVGVVRGAGKPYKPVDSSNKMNAVLIPLVIGGMLLAAGYYAVKYFDEYTIPVASEHGELVSQLFWITMGITGVIFLITHILLFGFSYKFRYREGKKAYYFPVNDKLEMIWTIVPAVVLTILVVYGTDAWTKITAASPSEAERVEIMGYQFAWKARYPGKDNKIGKYDYRLIDAVNVFGMDFSDPANLDDFSPRVIHLPKGKPVEFKIRSRDVIHSVFAPHFRLKMDAVPGMPTRFGFVPSKTTAEMREELGDPEFDYEIACTEVCGRGHFSMKILVVVEEPEEYEKWKAEQKSWLSKNPDYVTRVPAELRDKLSGL